MGKQDELAKFVYDMKQEGVDVGNHATHPDGVVFESLEIARIFADRHDKELTRIDGQVTRWLAKNRLTNSGPMSTKDGDQVIHHQNQLYLVWAVTKDGAQEPDPNVAPLQVWNRAEAEETARKWAKESHGRIFLLQKDKTWSLLSQ